MKSRTVMVQALFLQAIVVLVGMAALTFLLWEPHLEGRNANSTVYQVYFNDPVLAYAYFASISFFVGLYHAFRLLRLAGTNNVFSHAAQTCVRRIRQCALAMIVFVIIGECLVLPQADELPPPLFMGGVIILGSIVVATAMSLLEQILRNGTGASLEQSSALRNPTT